MPTPPPPPPTYSWPPDLAPDPLAPFRADVLAARAKMDAAATVSYPAYRNAQADYNEARETLRAAERRLNPAATDHHYLTT